VVDRNLLALDGLIYRAYLSEKTEDIARVDVDLDDGTSIRDLHAKPVNELVIHEADLEANGERLRFELDDQRDIRASDTFLRLTEALGDRATVWRAVVSVDDSPRLNCDFRTKTVSGITNSKPTLAEITRAAFIMFSSLAEPELHELAAFVGSSDKDQQTLF